jgi:hypothetical protein
MRCLGYGAEFGWQVTAYMDTAYDAGRNTEDMVTLEQLNGPAADLHTRNVYMEMKAKILSAKSADFIQTFNKQAQVSQAQVSQARSIATSLASRPSRAGQKSVDAMPDDPPKLSRTERIGKKQPRRRRPPLRRRLQRRPV